MSNIRILIVEDEEIVANDIKESLIEFDYEVIASKDNAKDAIQTAIEEKPDLILMDIKLKGEMDGIDTAKCILKEISVPIIYLTAFSDKATLDRAKVTDPFGYLLKPYKEVDLHTTIELALYKFKSEHGEAQSDSISDALENNNSEEVEKSLAYYSKLKALKGLTESQFLELAKNSFYKNYKSGEVVAIEGDEVSSGFLVCSGRLSVLKSSASGKELIVELLGVGDPFGLLCALDKQPYPYTTKAQSDLELLWIDKGKLLKVLDSKPDVFKNFTNETFDRLRNSHDISRSLAHDKVEVRVAAALLALNPKFETTVSIPLTRQELADLTGTTQETCIRVTRTMEKEGILDLSRNSYISILDEEKLEDISFQ